MSVIIQSINARPYALAFDTPLSTSRGRFTHRRGWLLSAIDAHGRIGWGDAAPWPGFGASDERVTKDIGRITDGRVDGLALRHASDIGAAVARHELCAEASFALELALLDLWGRAQERSIAALLAPTSSPPLRARTHVLVASTPPTDAPWLKVKVGAASLDQDEARLARIVAQAHPEARIRIDAGGAWSFEEAATAIPRLARYRVQTVEQPLPVGHVEQLARLREIAEAHDVVLAIDEEMSAATPFEELVRRKAMHQVVLKPMFLGGLLPTQRLAARAHDAGLSVCITHALESAIGRAGTRHLAATIDGIHGLTDMMADDVAILPERAGANVPLPPGGGLGVAPSSPGAPPSPAVTIPHPLRSTTIARPTHPAVTHREDSVTYRELSIAVVQAATELKARGVTADMTVALGGPHDVHFVTWLHAIGWLGAAAAPMPASATDDERHHWLQAVQPDLQIDAGPVRSTIASPSPSEERPWRLDEARLVVTTSGTTGRPRAVKLTTMQLMTSAFGSATRLGLDPADRWLSCLPLHHVGGLSILYRSLFYGTTVVLHDRFDADRVATAIDDGDVTLVSLVPNMLSRVLDARGARPFPDTLRAILLGGAHAPDELVVRALALDAPIARTWGMTEAASQVATTAPRSSRLVPLPFARVAADAGRLSVSGPIVGAETLVTADAGTVREDGAVQVFGRADDVIVTGGEKVSPVEIEAVLCRHPAVEAAAVVARPSIEWGKRPFALVQGRASTSELLTWCRQHLTGFKVPDGIHVVDTLPRAALGKVALREVHRILDAHFDDRPPKDGHPSEESPPCELHAHGPTERWGSP